jgi:chromosome segregation ATPase
MLSSSSVSRTSITPINGNRDDYDGNLSDFYNKKYQKDVDMYKDQMSIHLQTIGILVAEKTEIQSTLQQYIAKFDRKQEECDELNNRLKKSKQSVQELENALSNYQSMNVNIDSIRDEYEDYIESLKIDFNSKL